MSYRMFLIISISFLFLVSSYYVHGFIKGQYTWNSVQDAFLVNDKMITVATYNIQYGKGQDGRVDIGRTIEKLKSLDAQVIRLQEVERFSVRSGFNDQVKWMAEALDMYATFYSSLSFPGLYYGNAILSVFPIEDTKVLHFNNRVEDRSAIISTLKVSENERITVINTHLGLNYNEREKAIMQIKEKLAGLEDPVLLMGDLNSTPSMKEYKIWAKWVTKSNKGIPMVTYYKHDWQIDYIFHSDQFAVEDIRVMESETSDHYPLIGVFYLSGK
ncbi:endonuclease/exonuclease/phosphatase family metal-dependent hydrolase [Evansella vedderi]|uniref:Endonuclease/exonuclease/phosphatase family metal-dependent hydrolase n=1 Tax=Evansella vedderi TaxID=38282 RepID=A0ABT9ZRZ9_9BACI|nr:endonuclease/exonuclease/phosphatase family protein [Evansella vedderi]MDQ0253984.1 endonuclease/exonuclease/phosphatase family metal-dependent hydrolase [Evansella vedderi]